MLIPICIYGLLIYGTYYLIRKIAESTINHQNTEETKSEDWVNDKLTDIEQSLWNEQKKEREKR